MAHVAEWKKETVQELQDIISGNRTVAIVRIDRIPGAQLQSIRSRLRGDMKLLVAKKTLIKLALEGAKAEKKGIEALAEHMDGQAAIIGTDMNPFKLFKVLASNVQPMPAKGGEVAPHDIVIKAGETSFPPGPIVGELGKVGIPASIDKGKVMIKKEATPVKKGAVISRELAQVLTKLEVFPFSAGITVDGAYEDGLMYQPKDLDIDLDAYRTNLTTGIQSAFNLAVFTAYATPLTAVPLIQKARMQALSLAVFAGIVNKGSASLILSKAYGGMLALAQLMSADALDSDLQALLAGAAVASTAPAAPVKGAAKAEEKKDEPEKVSEDDAVAGLGALFG